MVPYFSELQVPIICYFIFLDLSLDHNIFRYVTGWSDKAQ